MVDILVPSLLNGISEQLPQKANPTTVKDCLNIFPDPTTGCITNKGSRRVYTTAYVPDTKRLRFQNPLNGDEMVLNISNTVEVVNLDTGLLNPLTIAPESLTYLTTGTNVDISKVGDFIVLWDKDTVVVEENVVVGGTPNNDYFLFVKAVTPGFTYEVRESGTNTVVASYTVPASGATTYQETVADSIQSQLTTNRPTWAVVRAGLTLKVTPPSGTTITMTTGSAANRRYQDIIIIKDQVGTLADLPVEGFTGWTVLVSGSASSKERQYVKFVPNSGTQGLGVWQETVKAEDQTTFDKTTIPQTLVFNATTGMITIAPMELAGREAGDAELNPTPSFVGETINDISTLQGRTVFQSDRATNMSNQGDIFNFYRPTITTIADSHPIDIDIPTVTVADKARFIIPFKEELLVYTDNQLFSLSSQSGIITPNNIVVSEAVAMGIKPDVAPVKIDLSVFSLGSGKTNINMIEVMRRDIGVYGQAKVNQQTPTLFTEQTSLLVAAEKFNTVFIQDGNEIIGYKYLNNGQERVQSAFYRLSTSYDTLEGMTFDSINDRLYLHGKIAEGTQDKWVFSYINLNLSDTLTPTIPFIPMVDDGIVLTVFTDPPPSPPLWNNQRVFTRVPALTDDWLSEDYVLIGYSLSTNIIKRIQPSSISPTTVTINNANIDVLLFGRPMKAYIEPHTFYPPASEDGSVRLPQPMNILQMNVVMKDSTSVTLRKENKQTKELSFEDKNNRRVSQTTAQVDTVIPEDFDAKFVFLGVNVHYDFRLYATDWLPFILVELQVRGEPMSLPQRIFL